MGHVKAVGPVSRKTAAVTHAKSTKCLTWDQVLRSKWTPAQYYKISLMEAVGLFAK